MGVDETGRVNEFLEKPEDPPPMPGHPDASLASMGIYVFNTAFLFERLIRDADDSRSSHDFGTDIIPGIINRYRVMAYPFRDEKQGAQAYWRDVGTVDSYWQSNLELIGVTPELNLYDSEWPIWTYQEQWPPAKFVFDDDDRRGLAIDSMVSGGCIISGSTVRHSLLFSDVQVNAGSLVQDSVILPSVSIGENCEIRRCVIDKGCQIPDGARIGVDEQEDARHFFISPGGVRVITPEMLGQLSRYVR